MSKSLLALLLTSVVVMTVAMPERPSGIVAKYQSKGLTISFTDMALPEAGKIQLCGTCASLTGQALNILLNYILNAGVVGGCSKVCGQLKSKTERTACAIACDLVGIKAFAKALEKADLDPIYFCEEVGVCKADDNGAGKIDTLSVSPQSAAQGTKFEGALQVTVTNHTGAGEFRFEISGGVDQPSGAGSVFPELAPGSYGVKIDIDTTPSQDPTQGPQWMPGDYNLKGAFCMGECGSKHPHSKIFGETNTTFTVTPQ